MPKMIICPDCGEEKPHYAKGFCKSCYRRQYYLKNREGELAYKRRYDQEHRREIAAYRRKWHKENPEYHREWCKANPDKTRAAVRRSYRQHREDRLAYAQQYYQNHKEGILAYGHRYYRENAEKWLVYIRRWRADNPDKLKAQLHRRIALKNDSHYDLSLKDIEEILAIGQAIYPDEKLHLDHIVPISKGGNTTRANMHAIPASLNIAKRDKLPSEAYGQLELCFGGEALW